MLLIASILLAVADVAMPVPAENQSPYWAGEGYWNRRHAAKIAEIAAGPKDYDFVFVGDSITHNWEGWSDPIDCAVVEKAYKTGQLKFPNGPGRKVWEEMKKEFRLLNLGCGGDTTANVLWRLEHGELDGYRARGFGLMIGTNNGEDDEEVAKGIAAIVRTIRDRHPESTVVLMPIFPCCELPTASSRIRNADVNWRIQKLVDGERLVWLDFNDDFLGPDGRLSVDMMPDYLHPLEPGYRIWRAAIEPVIRRLVHFREAKPVWPEGRAHVMNDFVTFRGSFEASPSEVCVLRLTGSTCYRVRLNGNFLAFGPARGPKGIFRVDEIPLGGRLADGANRIEIDVQGANVNSYEYMDQPSFLQAEVVCGNRVLLATGSGFEAFDTHERVRKVPRFNFQRLFAEAYRVGKSDRSEKLHLETRPTVCLLPRRVPFPAYEVDRSFRKAKTLRRRHDPSAEVWVGREITQVGEKGYKGYRPEELEVNVNSEVQRYVTDPAGDIEATVWRGRKVSAGFVGLEVRCTRPGRLVAFLSESERTNLAVGSNDGGFPVFWDIAEPGDYVLESFVPNSMMYVETFFDGGAADVKSVWVREFKSSLPFNRKYAGNDPELRQIYEAAAESLAQNAVDVYTDCPGRERAAWIGDTFFTGRAGLHLIGSTVVEDAFLENYALAERFDDIPDGALPMVYPGEHPDKVFIPNFCMWFGAQVAEYAKRGGNQAIVAALKPKLLGFVRYIDGFLNGDGLLENLPGWVFLEWSKASDPGLVKGVNYPSNMQYAGMLAALAELYGEKSLGERAAELRRTIRAKSWNGEWFRDSAASETCTECCQYYAFFFGVADFTRDRDLWERLVAKCGPLRDAKTVYPDLAPANSIFGYFMRFDMLLRTGCRDVLEREAKAYFLPMAQATGTIWENKDARGSNSHGLSSIAAYFVDPPACRCEQGKGQR